MSSHVDWKAVTDRVEKDFPYFIPVPSIGDTEKYKLLTFLSLNEQIQNTPSLTQSFANLFVAQQPPFYPIGRNIYKSKSKKKAVTGPKIHSVKLCNYNESENESSLKAGGTVNDNLSGEVEQQSTSPPTSLGTITQLTVDYEVLNNWIKKLAFDSDNIKQAQEGKLLIIHEVIMAEKLAFEGLKEETEYSGGVSTALGGIKGKYGWSRSTSNLSRPEDFGAFPIGYKVGKLRARQVNPGKEDGTSSSSSCFLKLERRRYFNKPYKERNFYETNESENDEQDSDEETRETHNKLSCFK